MKIILIKPLQYVIQLTNITDRVCGKTTTKENML